MEEKWSLSNVFRYLFRCIYTDQPACHFPPNTDPSSANVYSQPEEKHSQHLRNVPSHSLVLALSNLHIFWIAHRLTNWAGLNLSWFPYTAEWFHIKVTV